jgi:CDP-diacylglycerol--glycerol-3-phosphate 3-phosphatidyltransferase
LSGVPFSRILADALTLFRFFAAGLVWIGLTTPYPFGEKVALAAFLTGAISDFLDGRLARRVGFTAYGKILDPLADKALTLAAFAGLASRGLTGWWLVWIVAARDVIITWARFRVSPERSAARSSGKWKTAFQMLFIIAGLAVLAAGWESSKSPLLAGFMLWGSIAIAALTLWSGARFLAARRKI